MNYFDLAIIGVIVLFLLLGIYRGFIKTVISLISWAISFALIYFFAKKIAGALMNVNIIGNFFRDNIPKLFSLGEPGGYTVVVNAAGEKVILESGQLVSDALTNLMFPSFIQGMFMPYFVEGRTFMDGLIFAVSDYTLMSVATILIVIIVSIFIKIIARFVSKLVKRGNISAINRAFGGILYSGMAILFIYVAMIVIDLMGNMSFMHVVIQYRDSGVISSWIANNNPILMLFQLAK